jgi:putative membrane protein
MSYVCLSALALAACGGSSKPANDPAMATPAMTQSASDPATGMPEPGSLTDHQIAAIADGANSAEIAQAQLALTKASDPQVRQFATMMIEHHGEAKEELQKLNLSPTESQKSRQMAQKSQETLEQLQQKSGSEFDRAYMQAQLEGHRQVLEALNSDLLPNAKNPELAEYLQKMKPRVESHLRQAEAYNTSGTSTSGTGTSGTGSTTTTSASPSTR